MYSDDLIWPASTSLTGVILGIISLFVVDYISLAYCPFFGIRSLSIHLATFICLLLVISYVLLPRVIDFFASYANCNQNLHPEQYRKNFIIAFCLGGAFLFGFLLIFQSFKELSSPRIVWPFGLYITLLAFFHWSEFFVIALTSPSRSDIDFYLIDHSPQYLGALALSFVEYWLEVVFWPAKFVSFLWLNLTGLVVSVMGEAFRKVAMWTAADNFSHYLEYVQRREHRLVRNGIYSLCRHPAYAGWFFWSIGTQILLVNPLCSIVYPLAAYVLFRDRVCYEERCLIVFFGDAYRSYQREVPTGLPFIHGYLEPTLSSGAH